MHYTAINVNKVQDVDSFIENRTFTKTAPGIQDQIHAMLSLFAVFHLVLTKRIISLSIIATWVSNQKLNQSALRWAIVAETDWIQYSGVKERRNTTVHEDRVTRLLISMLK